MKINIPLDLIQANPWQTRKEIDEQGEAIQELAVDIAANGLLQIPIGRIVVEGEPASQADADWWLEANDVARELEAHQAVVQLAFGHRRLAAFYDNLRENRSSAEISDWTCMPVVIQQLTDHEMAAYAWSENEMRLQHTPLDRALAIQRRIEDFGWTQTEAAEQLGISRPAVSNSLRLLKLPEEITTALAKDALSERQAIALAAIFEMPESLRSRAEAGWQQKPSDIIDQAIDDNLSSDQIRSAINNLYRIYGEELQDAVFGLDEEFSGEGILSPFCRDCPQRFKERNICLDRDCFKLKTQTHKANLLAEAAKICEIPLLEADRDDNGYGYGGKYTHLEGNDREEGWPEKIIAGRCENLRLRYEKGHGNVDGCADARIVCGRMEQHCTCLAGLKAMQEQVHFNYDFDTRKNEKIVDAPLVILEPEKAERLSVEDMKEAARIARQEKHQLDQEKKFILEEAAERIAIGLTQKNLKTWKWLANEMHYSLNNLNVSTAYLAARAIAGHLIAGQTYPDSMELVLRNFNKVLRECGLEELAGWDKAEHKPREAASIPTPEGRPLVDILVGEEKEE